MDADPREASERAGRGRPRSADRTEAILEAAVEVMREVGWDGFTMQVVATRAGAGLATIYRRWPTKEDLIADAMRRSMEAMFVVDDGAPPRDQLAGLLTDLADKMCGDDGSMISVLAAAREHEAMSSALDDTLRSLVRTSIAKLIGELIGPSHPLVPTLTDATLGSLFFRSGMLQVDTEGPVFAAEILALIDAVEPVQP